jgi:hypothetical protein
MDLVNLSVSLSASQPASQSVSQSSSQPASQSVSQSVSQPVSPSVSELGNTILDRYKLIKIPYWGYEKWNLFFCLVCFIEHYS